ncbi:MAG TPA: exonuclease domain-containing protein [Limnochordia bacterium]|nr:exonuclease domain-containing protein [Limnochordia bacterium]
MAVQRLPRVHELHQNARLAGFIDVETTGLSGVDDEVVEFAMVLFAFDPVSGDILGIVDEYVGMRDPGRPIPPRATAVHGIRDADVRGKRLDERRIRELIDQAEFLVAHNARFDRAFVERLFPSARTKQWHCSMSEIPWKQLGFRSRGLHTLLTDHNIRIERAHRGLDDVLGALALLASSDSSGGCYFKYIVAQHYKLDPAGLPAWRTPSASSDQSATVASPAAQRQGGHDPKRRQRFSERTSRLFRGLLGRWRRKEPS